MPLSNYTDNEKEFVHQQYEQMLKEHQQGETVLVSHYGELSQEVITGLEGAVEEKITDLIEFNEDTIIDFVVTSIEDEKKGEKIILLISGVTIEEVLTLKQKITKSFDNKLMIPSSIKIVDEVPKLGAGKKDFSSAKKLALSLGL